MGAHNSLPRHSTCDKSPTDSESRPTLTVVSSAHPARGEQPSDPTILVQIGGQCRLFHTPDRRPYATVPVMGHWETWSLRSKQFEEWLSKQFYEHRNKAPRRASIQDALGVLEGHALYKGTEHPVFTRL